MTAFSLVAHRGYPRQFPDNSLAGIRAALDAGARYLEVDVQTSTDGTPYLFHDDDLWRVAGCAGELTELDDVAIGKLRAAEAARLGTTFADEPIARLSDLAEELARWPEVFCFVEIKPIAAQRSGAGAVVRQVLKAIEGLEKRTAIISFSLACLRETRALSSLALAPIIESWSDLDSPALRGLQPEFLFSNTRHLPEYGEINLPQIDGTRLVVYEVTDPDEAVALAERGAEFVETFHYPGMRAALAGRTS